MISLVCLSGPDWDSNSLFGVKEKFQIDLKGHEYEVPVSTAISFCWCGACAWTSAFHDGRPFQVCHFRPNQSLCATSRVTARSSPAVSPFCVKYIIGMPYISGPTTTILHFSFDNGLVPSIPIPIWENPSWLKKESDSDHVTTVDCQQTSDTGFANHPGTLVPYYKVRLFYKVLPKYFPHPSLSNKFMNTQHPISTCMDTHDRRGPDTTSGPDCVHPQVSSCPLSSSTHFH